MKADTRLELNNEWEILDNMEIWPMSLEVFEMQQDSWSIRAEWGCRLLIP